MADESTPGARLAQYVQAVAAEDVDHAESCSGEANTLVTNAIGEGNPYQVPEDVIARCVLEVGADLYYRKRTRHGIAAFDGIDVAPIRIARDPMTSAWPLLRQFIPVSLA